MNEKLKSILEAYQGKSDELIPILQEVQDAFGYLPEDVMLAIANFIHVPASRVFAVASFYAQFRFSPLGRKRVMVCRGTARHVKSATKVLEEVKRRLGIQIGETTRDRRMYRLLCACTLYDD
jgi:NADH-quinone oxidoreductase subunit E